MSDLDDKITCAECGAKTHSIQLHLNDAHPGMALADYQAKFPGQPVLSKRAEQAIAARAAAQPATAAIGMAGSALPANVTALNPEGKTSAALHEVFGLLDNAGNPVPAAKNGRGEPIPVTIFATPRDRDLVPEVDNGFIFDIDNLKNALMALELRKNLYVWGHAGTGKTTLIEQVAARTGRPVMRVQHSIGTEESHVLGQWVVRGGQTEFQPGLLPLAMRNGWIYLADEYDFGLPAVLSVYQPILEPGKSLVIKDAPEEWRVVKPHENFRFVATGNTNGSGDETGLYQGTQIQNAANYDRFGMVLEATYMKPELESAILVNRSRIQKVNADKLVDFANRVRESYKNKEVASTISPRCLIDAADIGMRKGSWRAGLTLSFINKLSAVDRAVVDGVASRVFDK
ncbi:AAA family ATPase [Paraburkholderia sp. RCC_158]|uniref:AAA family ATPase n=1 Tax=Paraburkholderia sp. RCC_158 TaxID=3239220 RepID=UPI0035264B64